MYTQVVVRRGRRRAAGLVPARVSPLRQGEFIYDYSTSQV
jgi:hypothetical protein